MGSQPMVRPARKYPSALLFLLSDERIRRRSLTKLTQPTRATRNKYVAMMSQSRVLSVAGSMPLFISLHTSKSDGDDTGGGGDTGRIRPADNGLLIVKREETLSVANHPPITIEECSSSC